MGKCQGSCHFVTDFSPFKAGNHCRAQHYPTILGPFHHDLPSHMSRTPDPYGRDARRPYHIPLRGWWQVAQRVWTESGRDNLSVVSAGCAFFALFAIFPALSALIALYGLTANPATVEQQFGMLADVLPAQAYDVVIEQVRRLGRQ